MAGADPKSDALTATSGSDLSNAPAPKRRPLSKEFQKIVDKDSQDDTLYDELWDGTAPESTDSNVRYAAYATRLRTALLAGQRYVAYTSDIGESFRPVAPPAVVRTAYGISWAYLIGDVCHEGYKAYCQNQITLHPNLPRSATQSRYNDGTEKLEDIKEHVGMPKEAGKVAPLEDYRAVMVQRAVFQSLASMALPAFTIHSIVRYSGQALKNTKNVRLRTWGPIGLGLATVPALPYLFDEPVETAVEWIFHKGFETFGSKGATGNAPSTGRERLLDKENKAERRKEKEL